LVEVPLKLPLVGSWLGLGLALSKRPMSLAEVLAVGIMELPKVVPFKGIIG
jgi:hypothetical protein